MFDSFASFVRFIVFGVCVLLPFNVIVIVLVWVVLGLMLYCCVTFGLCGCVSLCCGCGACCMCVVLFCVVRC